MSSKNIVAQIIADIERYGKLPWEAGWLSSHINGLTGKPYTKCNRLLLSIAMYYRKYSIPIWFSHRDIRLKRGSIKAGAKGAPVYCFFPADEKKAEKLKALEDNDNLRAIYSDDWTDYMKIYRVFNIAETTFNPDDFGIETASFEKNLSDAEKYKYINAIKKDGVKIIEGGSTQAYYDCASDVIRMPARASFVSQEKYYANLIREIVHSTSNPKRLGRFKDYIPSKERYSFEELGGYSFEKLVVEIASNIIYDRLGINTASLRIRNASYLQGWINYLRKRPSITIFDAVYAAEKIVEYLDNLVEMQGQSITKKFGTMWKNLLSRFPKKN